MGRDAANGKKVGKIESQDRNLSRRLEDPEVGGRQSVQAMIWPHAGLHASRHVRAGEALLSRLH